MSDAPSAEYFDRWYGSMRAQGLREELVQRHLGLPPRLLSTSLLTWGGIAEVVEALRLEPGDRLLDLACGRGGYGLEIAARTQARLTGVDFSAEAIRQATENAQQAGAVADFRVGELTATGLPSASFDAVVCVDAIQFSPVSESYAELRRILEPGGRVALTSWEALDPADERVSPRIRAVETERGLSAAGFLNVEIRERPQWRAAERELWEAAAALDPGDDPDVESLRDESLRVLPQFDLIRRVLAVATAP